MNRANPIGGVLAGLATFAALCPLMTLFETPSWLGPAIWTIAAVCVTGVVGRWLAPRPVPVALLQIAVVALVLAQLHLGATLENGLPGPDTWDLVRRLALEARDTVMGHAAPAPVTPGISAAIGTGAALAALAVDHIGVTRRSPALAGMPLLACYLVSASNSPEPVNALYFLFAAASWLLLMGTVGVDGMRRWSAVVPLRVSTAGRTRDTVAGLSAAAQGLAITALAAAVLLPQVIPHMPTTFLADGLGRASTGRGNSSSAIELNEALDLSRNLRNPSDRPVLTYTTDDKTPGPLRVATVQHFTDNLDDIPADRDALQRGYTPPVAGWDVASRVPTEARTLTVTENHLRAPQLAVPERPVAGELGGTPWTIDSRGTALVQASPGRYTVDYLKVDPSAADLRDLGVAWPSDDRDLEQYLPLDPASADAIRELTSSVVPEGTSPLEAATLIQEHLRDTSTYTYSLDLADPEIGADGQPVSVDPIVHFLRTKQGYCQQFASTMVLMARSRGIPARLAIGFRPGQQDGDGTWSVKASDAHAWPELYFREVGWLRFEPTPGSRSGAAPDYSVVDDGAAGSGTDDTSSSSTSGTPGASESAAPRVPEAQNDAAATGDPGTDATGIAGVPAWAWALLVLTLFALFVASIPLLALVRWRRARARAVDEAALAEVEWQRMMRRISDLGVTPPDGNTPRQAGEYLRRRAHLVGEDQEALGRVVATLERARYAPPGVEVDDIGDDATRVIRAVSTGRRRWDRLWAATGGGDGMRGWRELWHAVTGAPGRLWSRWRQR
ncbi:transglutaminase TgpA family protein [Janibacter sp. G56]|uniref:transglutaminase TgpA family protein n=1 Tax=Janibacter sp. G56 TaxID=3418717 RepID=UPI003D08F1FF